MSLNNHECDHNNFIGQVSITPEKIKAYGNNALFFPLTTESTIENEDGTITKLLASGITFAGNSDSFRIRFQCNDDANSYAEIATSDNGNEPIYVRQYDYQLPGNSGFCHITRTLTLLDTNGNTSIPGDLTIEGNVVINGSLRVKGNIIKVNSDGSEKIIG